MILDRVAVEPHLVGKIPKAHSRPIVKVQFVVINGRVGLCSVGHDSLKFWQLDDVPDDDMLVFSLTDECKQWRCGVQRAAILPNGTGVGVVGLDSVLYSLSADDEGRPQVLSHDLGYMEVWHIACLRPEVFITTSYSGSLSEVIGGKFARREQFRKVRAVTELAMCPSLRLLAAANHDGAVEVIDTRSMKSVVSFEGHAMKIRALSWFSEDHVLTGGEDKTIKLFKIVSTGAAPSHSLERMFCGHRSPISALSVAPEATRRFASSSTNGQIVLWCIDSTTPLAHLAATHEGAVHSLSFSPCGQYLVSCGEDRMLAAFRVAMEPVDDAAPCIGGREVPDESQEEDFSGGFEPGDLNNSGDPRTYEVGTEEQEDIEYAPEYEPEQQSYAASYEPVEPYDPEDGGGGYTTEDMAGANQYTPEDMERYDPNQGEFMQYEDQPGDEGAHQYEDEGTHDESERAHDEDHPQSHENNGDPNDPTEFS